MKRMHSILGATLLLVLISIACSATAEEAPSISPAELHALRATDAAPLVLDVRTEKEFAEGHLPGALNIPHDEIQGRLAEIDAPNGVVVHCAVGPRARKGEATLMAAGVESVRHLDGGFLAWKAAGYEITK